MPGDHEITGADSEKKKSPAFHGSHISPSGIADNVLLNIRPSPRGRDGKPLVNAWVNFSPIGSKDHDPGPTSQGKTDAGGRFTLRVDHPTQPGAVVGKSRVYITTATAIPEPTPCAVIAGAAMLGYSIRSRRKAAVAAAEIRGGFGRADAQERLRSFVRSGRGEAS